MTIRQQYKAAALSSIKWSVFGDVSEQYREDYYRKTARACGDMADAMAAEDNHARAVVDKYDGPVDPLTGHPMDRNKDAKE